MLIVNMLADDPVNIDNEDLSQNETRTLKSCGMLRMFLVAPSEQSRIVYGHPENLNQKQGPARREKS
jgi:hypothetical protein